MRRGAVHRSSVQHELVLHGSRVELLEFAVPFARQGIALRIIGARGRVRDLLRADGIEAKVGGLDRRVTLDEVLGSVGE